MTHSWSPEQYLRYEDERARPFLELTARIHADAPRRVVDLGAGPGTLTSLLAERWPDAEVTAVDSSPEMIERARGIAEISAVRADLRCWEPSAPVDVLVSNAALQWVDDHLALLPRLVGMLAPGGWLAMQVPGNFEEPSHR
ncbi:MAG: methyltransferase domain-containing protein, partial [Brachybacterium alimentarium]